LNILSQKAACDLLPLTVENTNKEGLAQMFKGAKILVTVTVILLASLFLAGCGIGKNDKKDNLSQQTQKEQVLTYNLGSEPKTIDPGQAAGQPELTVVNAIMEGLTRYNLQGELEPAMARGWEVSSDGTTYLFYIREEARWSNGEPVTAHDFEYAWKRVLDPQYAANYAYQLYYLVNGPEYNDGNNTGVTDPDMVGVKALDAKTLEVTLSAPVPQFLGLTAFPTYFPVHQATVEANPNWHLQPETYVHNGPFKLAGWENYQRIILEKNTYYWNQEEVKLDKLIFTLVSEQGTALALFETGKADIVFSPPSQELARLRADAASGLEVASDLAVSLYLFNTLKKPFDNVKVRQALAMAIDREAVTDYVTGGGERPAYAYVPYGLPDARPGIDFRETGGALLAMDLDRARELLKEAGYPEGKGFPEVELLINDSATNLKVAQAVQEMWKQNLGISTVKIRPMEWRLYLQTIFSMEHQLAGAGWSADYVDAMTFLDVYLSNGGNNKTGFSNSQYDSLIALANSSGDQEARIKAMHQAEKILMDELPVMPVFFYTKPYLVKEHVKNIRVPSFGPQVEFKWAYISK
jgi:oligopeptide transport system substrate-binding protein